MYENDKRLKIALFRYSVIAPLVCRRLEHDEAKVLRSEILLKLWEHPSGPKKPISERTLRFWLARYRKFGFTGLFDSKYKVKLPCRSILLDDQSQTVLETPSSASITTDKSKVIPWLTRLKSATTLDALEKLLKEFSAGEWTLIDKRDVSEAYTPVAIKLIDAEQANKWQTLENLASLCWRPTHHG